ncbi:MAG: ExeM/NucH family extracellular endonuclease [Cyanobacteria bacterium P01_D01_bin.156]
MATTLTAGGIAIVGFNFDNPDEFAFVSLVDLEAGTEINFTDNGWQAAGSFRSTEGTFTWTAPTDIAAGTVVNPAVSSILFSASGDQILAYQGDATNPTFIYALNSEGNPGVWQSDATSSNISALPTGLVDGESAVALDEIDNAIYTGTTSGTKAELLAAISDSSNWSGNNSTRQTLPTSSFTIGGGATPLINEFQPNPDGADPADVTFELSGEPSTSFSGWILSVEADFSPGQTVDRATQVSGTFDSNGLLTVTVPDLENPSFTVILTDTFTGSIGDVFDVSLVGTVFDAIGIPDIAGDETNLLGAALGGTDFAFTGAEPELVFRDGTTGDLYAVNNVVSGTQVFDVNGNSIDPANFDINPIVVDTFGAVNPSLGSAPAPTVAIADVSQSEGNSGTTAFTFTVTRSGDTSGTTTVDFATSDGTATAGSDYTANSGTLTFNPIELTKTISVNVTGDTTSEPDEDFAVTLSNPTGGTITTADAVGTIQNDDGVPITLISDIQGSPTTQGNNGASPLDGQTVTIEAIVVGDFQDGTAGTNGDFNGFYVQEEDTDADADAATSEGLFIFDGSSPAVDVNVGDTVQVTGTVGEFFGETQLSNVTVTVVDSNDNSNLVTPATITFPVASTTTNSDGDLIADLEAFEGMLVTMPQELTVADLFTLGRFGDMGLYADGRLETFTQGNAPSVSGFQAYQDLAVRNTVILDDGSTIQNPADIPFEIASAPGNQAGELDANDQLRSGDTVNDLTGVVRYSRGSGGSGDEIYRINPTVDPVFVNKNPRPTTAPDVGGDITVASFNVLNFFTSLDDDRSRNNNPLNAGPSNLEPRGANDLTTASTTVAPSTQAQNDPNAEFNRQVDKLVAALSETQADIFSLVELENEFGGDQNGDGRFAIDFLVNELNTVTGANYQFVDPGQNFIDTSDAISVGLVYNADTIAIASDTTVEILDDSDLPALGLGITDPVFDGPSTNRAALAVTFEEIATGETFTVAANHFKSKGSPGTASTGDQDIGDGVGSANQTRLNAATALDAWLDTDPTGSGDEDFLIIGDLNAYAMEDPIQYLLSEGYADQVDRFLDPGEFEYSFGFPVSLSDSPQVQSFGALDYALATSSLADQITGAAEWHINADESVIFDYNLEFRPQEQADDLYGVSPFRSSDHDPLIIGLDLTGGVPPIDRINDYTIFSQEVNNKSFIVNLIDGEPVYTIDGSEIANPSLNNFLSEAVAELGGSVARNGTINEGGLEHFGNNRNPSVRQRYAYDDVIISGSGVSGRYRANFDNDAAADAFEAFADDLLGRDPAKTQIFEFRGNTNGGANRIQIFVNDEITGLNSEVRRGLATPDSLEFRWSGADVRGRQTVNNQDEFWEAMGPLFDGVQIRDGQVTGFGTQNQARLVGNDLNQVDFGASGIGGKEVWGFDNQLEAQNFLNLFDGVVEAIAAI